MAANKARSNKYSGLLSSRGRGAAAQRPWRPLAVLGVLLVALYATMFGVHATHPRLAIDLAGGTSAVFAAEMPNGGTPSAADMAQAVSIMQNRVNGYGVSEATVTPEGGNTIDVEIPGQYSQATVNSIGATAHLYFREVLTEQAAGQATTPTTTTSPSASATGTSTAKAGASASASSTAKASTSASSAVTEKASGQSDSESAVADAASTSASADASTSAGASSTATAKATGTASAAASPGSSAQANAAYAQYQALNCSKDKNSPANVGTASSAAYLATCGLDGTKYLLGPSIIDGKHVTSAIATETTANGVPTGAWQVDLSFDATGTKEFATETTSLYQQVTGNSGTGQFAVTLDGIVQSAPVVQSAITNGQATINGSVFTESTAKNLATTLSYGSLPLNFSQSQVSIVSPTLGGSELQGGLIAGAIGLALVFLYVILYYRGLSIAAISSLVVAAALTYSLACLFGPLMGFTLSLEGVAGLIVAIGITADSFVVFFERLRDELREGRSLRSAVRQGWIRARRTIVSSDMVTLLAAVVLYELTVGSVQGFAFTLGMSTVIDLLVVFMFTMPMITLFSRTSFFGNGHPWSGLDPESLGAKRQTSQRAGARGRMTIAERRRQEAEAAAGAGSGTDENNQQSVEA
ncbi:MAG TPA: protein translocase subunit SecD [Actinospica sp.]|nr:protein translocase subunit SecD [Actinospica sp.]